MPSPEPGKDTRAVPRLAPDLRPEGLSLSTAEGFLLSRIDGATPWSVLRQIGVIPPDEVDRCLDRWLAEGLVLVNGTASAEAEALVAAGGADPRIEAAIDIPVERQERILAFEEGLGRPYHEILGVSRNADARDIKRAYFELSKEFHPDRYFRREIGDYGRRLNAIFKKIVEAYELLSDPTTRAEIERSLGPVIAEPQPAVDGAQGEGAPQTPITLGRREMLDRLRRSFRIPEEVLTERRFKARKFYDSAVVASRKERWLEAAASIRLAIAFDPYEDEYKDVFAGIQSQVHQLRALELLEKADASWDHSAQAEALGLYEEALCFRPHDGRACDRAAQLALDIGELDRAREHAERACELGPENGGYHCTLGRVLRALGATKKAVEALESAVRLDPNDTKAKAELESLRRRRRRPA